VPTAKTANVNVYEFLQPIAQQWKSYLKDSTHFINSLEEMKVPENTILVSINIKELIYKYTTRGGGQQSDATPTKHSRETNLLSLHNYCKEQSNLS